MNAPATPNPAGTVKVGQTMIRGRCSQVRKSGDNMHHLVVMPALDEYSSPSTVLVAARRRLADVGADVTVLCRVTGYKRQYQTTDPDTGEKRTVHTADVRLIAVEAD